MTREEVLAMKPGEELDAAVAERIMGLKPGIDFGEWPEHQWKLDEDGAVDIFAFEADHHNGPRCERCWYGYCVHCQDGPTEPCVIKPEPYSKDIAAAWRVVRALLGRDCDIEMTGSNDGWCVAFEAARTAVAAHGATPAEAICRAALLLEEEMRG